MTIASDSASVSQAPVRESLPPTAQAAFNTFKYLFELKKLYSKPTLDVGSYDEVLWISDIPQENECFTRAWGLVRDEGELEKETWLEISKPRLESPPEVPNTVEILVDEKSLKNSALDQPELLEVSNEVLLRHFLQEDEDYEPETEKIRLDDHEEVFERYFAYLDNEWIPWAELRRREKDRQDVVPTPPEELTPWIKPETLNNFELQEPELKEHITVEVNRRAEEIREKIAEEWKGYVDRKWKPWAESDRRLQKIQRVYNQLYSIYQRQQKLGEQYEVVFAFGLLSWAAPKTGTVKRHIFTVQCNLEFVANRGTLFVGPSLDDKNNLPLLEYDMLDPSERPQGHELEFLNQQVSDVGEEFWDQAKITNICKTFVNALVYDSGNGLKSEGEFENSLERPGRTGETPRIHLAPALILRKRSQRGFLQFFSGICEHIENGGLIPLGVEELVCGIREEVPSEIETEISEKDYNNHLIDGDVYFPLPANNEQREIVNRLNRGRGVLVQGPPGTGKSHTITNLICHLLATGNRILVTSETPRALNALRSKFTDGARDLSELCVLLLGNDEGALKELEKSVSAINNKKNQWSASRSENEIKSLELKLDEIRKQKQSVATKMRQVREQDVYEHHDQFGEYSGKLSQIAQRLNDERPLYQWLEDSPSEVVDFYQLPFTPNEFVERWARYRLEFDESKAPSVFSIEKIPTPSLVGRKFETYRELQEKLETFRSKGSEEVASLLKSLDSATFQSIAKDAHQLHSKLSTLEQHVQRWAGDAGREIAAEQDRTWRELFRLSTGHLESLRENVATADATEVQGIELAQSKPILNAVERLLEYLEEYKKFGFRLLLPREIKAALKALKGITVNGEQPVTVELLKALKGWLVAKEALTAVEGLWVGKGQPPIQSSFSISLAHYEDVMEPLELALSIHPLVQSLQNGVDAIPKLESPKWHITEDVKRFCYSFDVVTTQKQLAELGEELTTYVNELSEEGGLQSNYRAELCNAIKQLSLEDYASAYSTICEENDLNKEFIDLLKCVEPLKRAIPKTFSSFDKNIIKPEWPERFESLRKATAWACADKWVEEICDPQALESLTRQALELDKDEGRCLGALAAQKAWHHCMERLTERQRQALVAWRQQMEKIGKGYGKHVERLRRQAREKMVTCREAIPAWVMPLHKVVETVPTQPELFDVAIIDEASQSGPEAMLLNFIAKKVIVVGDDKQIRPQHVGIDENEVEILRKLYLKSVEHSETFDLRSSYFSQTEVRFPNYIRLREHFRCMPEIIQFSNNNFYFNEPLIPLRQYGTDRLEPVVETIHVADGYRKGESSRTINLPEAKAIVDRISELCADPAYEDKSIGVIALLGKEQAKVIEKLLMDEIDKEEIEARNIIVGEPYTFQGDERDIICISMVDAPLNGGRCRAVTSQKDQRAFNVAASRARDQLILFHTPTLNHLKPDCLRFKLLDHCLNPKVEQSELIGETSIHELRLAARDSSARSNSAPSPFDSWFEVDVFLDIVSRGYRVIPQYEVNPFRRGYRIDLVVEGLQGRLAVECDGDEWHGPEAYDKDMARQRDLERAGWKFWRVRGGAYYRDKEQALSSLWQELDKLQIFGERGGALVSKESVDLGSEQRVSNGRDDDIASATSEVSPTSFDGRSNDQMEFDSKSTYDVPQNANATNSDSANSQKFTPGQRRHVSEVTAQDIQSAILFVLENRPRNSIAIKALTREVCQALGIRTRGNPWQEFDRKVRRSVGVLMRKEKIEQYKSKNERIRLIVQNDGFFVCERKWQ